MGLNKAMNATIAYLDGRTDIAKEIFRDATSDVVNISPLLARLDLSVNKIVAMAFHNALKQTLRVQLTPVDIADLRSQIDNRNDGTVITDKVLEIIFMQGVRRTESVFERILEKME